MKKTVIRILSVLILMASVNVAYAKVKATSPETAQAIKYYKSGNYAQAYIASKQIVEKDPSNALAQYYFAMSNVQLGNKVEAISAYDKVISLSSNGILGSYAKKGKRCIEEPSMCHQSEKTGIEESLEDKFIKGSYGSGLSKDARAVHERAKIENLKREINRNNEVAPEKFKGYKDFSSYAPTNDEIVAAIRVLQQAGLTDAILGNGYRSDVNSILGNGTQDGSYELMNMLYADRNGSSNLNPMVIQSLLSTQMSANF